MRRGDDHSGGVNVALNTGGDTATLAMYVRQIRDLKPVCGQSAGGGAAEYDAIDLSTPT